MPFSPSETTMSFIIGTGAFKLGVNYAPGVMPQREAARKGYAQNLWLHGPEHYLTEVRTLFSCGAWTETTLGWHNEHIRRV
jgi:hypothetical protein